jgi:hypothetical protein
MTVHSHEVSLLFGSAGSCRHRFYSNCVYVPSKVMPYMEPLGRFDRQSMLVHGFTLSALDARQHGSNCLIATQSITKMLLFERCRVHSPKISASVRSATTISTLVCVIKDHVLPPANEPRDSAQHSTIPPKGCVTYSDARTTYHRTSVVQLSRFLSMSRFMFNNLPPVCDRKTTLSPPQSKYRR